VQDTGHRGAPVQDRYSPVDGVVRVGPLMGVPAMLLELGREPEPIFDSAGLKLALFADADNKISYAAASRLLAHSVAATGCRHFGLLVGQRAGPSSLGVAGFMLRSAPDIGTALRGLVQHLDLHDQGGVPMLIIKGDLTLLGYAIQQSAVEASDQIYDLSITIACNIMRSLRGEGWNPTEVILSRRRPQDLAPYRRVFRAPIRFNAEQSAVVFPTCLLDYQIPSADPLLHRHLEKEATELHSLQKANIVPNLRGLLCQVAAGAQMHGCRCRQTAVHARAHVAPAAAKGRYQLSPRTR